MGEAMRLSGLDPMSETVEMNGARHDNKEYVMPELMHWFHLMNFAPGVFL